MSSAQKRHPIVRGACEACHTRKVRCKLPPEGGPCTSCTTAGRQCFFLPRVRSGRPRATDDGGAGGRAASRAVDPPPRRASTRDSVPGTGRLSPQNSGGVSVPAVDCASGSAMFAPNGDCDPFDPNWIDAGALGFAQLDAEAPAAAGSAHTFLPSMSVVDAGADTMNLDPALMSSDSFDRFLHNVPEPLHHVTSHHDQGSTERMGMDNTEVGAEYTVAPVPLSSSSGGDDSDNMPPALSADDASFSSMLELTTKLHHHVTSLSRCLERHRQGLVKPDLTMSNRALHALLQSVDCTCTSITAIFGPPASSRSSPRSDHSAPLPGTTQAASPPASRPLTSTRYAESGCVSLAAIFQIFQAFERLSEYRVAPETQHSADFLLLYKRCEFNLTQTKVALTQIGLLIPCLLETTRQAAARANVLELHFADATREHSRLWS